MGDHHHTAAEVVEEILQHAQGVHIEVVGGFIEQQHIRRLDQQAAEVQPPPLAAGKPRHRLVLLGRRKQKPLQQLGGAQLLAVHLHPAGRLLHHIDHLALDAAGPGASAAAKHVAVLIEVGQLHRGTQLQAAAGGRAPAGDHLQQAGFAHAVRADDPHPVLRAEVVAEVPQQGRAISASAGLHAQPFRGDRLFADPPRRGRHADAAAGLALRLLAHLLDALQPGLLLGAAGLRPLAQPGQFAPQGAAEAGRAGHLGRLLLRPVGQVGGVVALVAPGLTPFHRHDPPGHPVEQVAVVGDEHQGAGIAVEVALQPLHPIGIEMVGGFVQQQHIGFGHQGRRQGHPASVATGELRHPPAEHRGAGTDAEPLKHLAALLLQPPGVAAVHALVQVAELVQQLRRVRIGGQGLAEPFVVAQQRHPFAAAGEHLLQHGALRVQVGFLVEQHHLQPGGAAPLAALQRFAARQHLQQGALAGPVRADQAQPVPLAHV